MAVRIAIAGGIVHVVLPPGDQFLALHGSLQIPISCITNAYVSSRSELHLRWRLLGTGAGSLMTAGRFTDDTGAVVFCDLTGSAGADCLVIEAKNFEFEKIALTMADGVSPNDVAHAICRSLV